jgi:hypothetical protein
MPKPHRQKCFFHDIHNNNFLHNYPDDAYSYTDLREGTMTLQEFIAYFANNYRIGRIPRG